MNQTKAKTLNFVIVTAIFLSLTVIFAVLAHIRFETFKLNEHVDMGYFNQLFYILTTSDYTHISLSPHGMTNPHVTAHFFPFMYLMLPFYKILPSVQTILTIQTIVILSGAFAIYGISSFWEAKNKTALALAAFYIVNPYTVFYIFNDFRFLQMSIAFILFSYLFYLKKKMYPFLFCVFLSFSCREEIAFIYPFFPFLIPKTKEKNSYLWIFLPSLLSFFWYFFMYRLFFVKAISAENIVSPYLLRSWILNPSNHFHFIKESIKILLSEFWHFKVFFIFFILRKPSTLLIIYPFAFLSSINENPLKNFSGLHWFSSIHYTAIQFVFIFIAFTLFITKNNKPFKNILLYALLLWGAIVSFNDIRFNIFTDEEISPKENKQLINYINTELKEKSDVILTDSFFAPILSNYPKVFLADSIPANYPNISELLKNVKFILIYKEKLYPELKEKIKRQPHKTVETENYYLIKLNTAFDINPFLSEPDTHLSIYK